MIVRDAGPEDLERINEIYNWTIDDNFVSFDIEPYDLERRLAWWQARDPQLVCLVAEEAGEVVGVAYSSWYRPKLAYRSSMETTIVLDTAHRGRGVGTSLLGELIARLADQGVHLAVAIVTLPNDASVALHHKLGYRTVGTLREVGYKNGRYWDTILLERRLGGT